MENEVMEINRHHSPLILSTPTTLNDKLPHVTHDESIATISSLNDNISHVITESRPPSVSNGDHYKTQIVSEHNCQTNQHHTSESSQSTILDLNSQQFGTHSIPTPPPSETTKDLSLIVVPPINNRDADVISPQVIPHRQKPPSNPNENLPIYQNILTEVLKSQYENEKNHNRIPMKRKATDDERIGYGMHRDKIFKNNNKKKYNPFNLMPDADLPQDLFNDGTDTNNHHLPPTILSSSLQLPSSLPQMMFNSTSHHQHQQQKQHSMNGSSTDEIRNFLRDQIKFWGGGRLNDGGFFTNEYAQYLGLQPAVKFKCFKCGDAQFSSLFELKEHQVMCLKRANVVPPNPSEFLTSTTILTPPPIASQQKPSTTLSNQKNNGSNQNGTLNDPSTKIRITRKVFLCSACGTYYENWNLFLHMREVHKRHICLYCLGLFPSSDRLLSHLTHKHNITEEKFDSREHLMQTMKSPCYLMCSNCEHVFNEIDNFSNHLCENYMEPCVECDLKSVHKPNCSIGIAAKAAIAKSKKERDKTVVASKKKHSVPNGFADVNGISPPSTSTVNTYRDYPNNNTVAMDLSHSHYNENNIAPPTPPQTASPKAPSPPQNNTPVTATANQAYNHSTHHQEKHDNENVPSDMDVENPTQQDNSFENDNDNDDDNSSSSSDESQSSDSSSSSSSSDRGESRGFAQIVSTGEIPPEASQSEPGTPLLVPKLKIKFNQKSFQSSFNVPPPLPSEDESDGDDDENDDEDANEDANEDEEEEVEEEEEQVEAEENDTVLEKSNEDVHEPENVKEEDNNRGDEVDNNVNNFEKQIIYENEVSNGNNGQILNPEIETDEKLVDSEALSPGKTESAAEHSAKNILYPLCVAGTDSNVENKASFWDL